MHRLRADAGLDARLSYSKGSPVNSDEPAGDD